MTQIKEYGFILLSFFDSNKSHAVLSKGFRGFWRFLMVNTLCSFLFYGIWLFSMYGTKVLSSFDYVSWTFHFLLNVFLVTFAFGFTLILGALLMIYWIANRFNRNDLELREYVLTSLYSTVVMSNIVVLFFACMMYIWTQLVS